MPNINATTGIRYGVIAFNSLDPDLANDLWTNGRDLSYEEARADLRANIAEEADALEEQVADDRPGYTGERLYDAIEAMWLGLGYRDRDDYIDAELERRQDMIEIAEPLIQGEYQGVKYEIHWLGGAPLLSVTEGPIGLANRLCSPCVPNAADLDGGFVTREERDALVDGYVEGASSDDLDDGWTCYAVPRDWLAKVEVSA